MTSESETFDCLRRNKGLSKEIRTGNVLKDNNVCVDLFGCSLEMLFE